MNGFNLPPGFKMPEELTNMMDKMVEKTIGQAKGSMPKKRWFIKKFNSIDEIKDFFVEQDNLSDVQIDFEKLFLLFAKDS